MRLSLISSINSPKSWALFLLIIQNAGLSLMMRYTFIYSKEYNFPLYISSTAVILSETLKFLIANFLSLWLDHKFNLREYYINLSFDLLNTKDLLHLFIPSLLYTIQNSLQYYAMSTLSAPVFQVLYQMKVITTAIFTVILLPKKLHYIQWISIFILTIGVIMVQLSQNNRDKAQNEISEREKLFGLIAVLVSCVTSGFAGVYFELFLKSSNVSSIWMRNIQMSLIGMIFASFSCWMKDSTHIMDEGFFQGYNKWVTAVIFLQAAGGMLVALVLKYADNVLKGFATSLSIILSVIFSYVYFHDVHINTIFVVGSFIVFLSVFLYGNVPSHFHTISLTSTNVSTMPNESVSK